MLFGKERDPLIGSRSLPSQSIGCFNRQSPTCSHAGRARTFRRGGDSIRRRNCCAIALPRERRRSKPHSTFHCVALPRSSLVRPTAARQRIARWPIQRCIARSPQFGVSAISRRSSSKGASQPTSPLRDPNRVESIACTELADRVRQVISHGRAGCGRRPSGLPPAQCDSSSITSMFSQYNAGRIERAPRSPAQ